VFFSATKLFQNQDMNLRRMVYLCIKDICPSADEVIIVTSSLMKDMNSKVDLYRSNSVRVLCKIIDSQLLMQVCSAYACLLFDMVGLDSLVGRGGKRRQQQQYQEGMT
jgi:vesicle coat complex subunit